MKVVVIGAGYVGLVSAVCFSDMGHEVVCVDNDESKIKKLKQGVIPIYEPSLDKILDKNVKNGRLDFTTDIASVLEGAEVILLAVGTPTEEETGRADLKYVFSAAHEVAVNIRHKAVIVTKSTVPVGTGAQVADIFNKVCPAIGCEVVSNPEFLREGVAIYDFMNPDRIIVGADSIDSKNIMQRLYRSLIGAGTPILFTNIATAELIKYASNAFLATKIAFANEISDICEGVGANVDMVIKGMGMDKRIGGSYMHPGPGYGGSCFPKDTLALKYIATDAGFPTAIVESVIRSNDDRRKRMVKKIIAANDGGVKGKNIAILGLAFKANTDDMRYSPSLVIIPDLIDQGANIYAYDPQSMNEAKKELQHLDINWCDDVVSAITGSDALVILTEWEEFKKLDIAMVKSKLKGNIIIDLRNILSQEDVLSHGLKYISVGR